MPEISFAPPTLSVTRKVNQADSTETIQTVFDYTKFPDYNAAHFPIDYRVEALSASGPTVSIDVSVTPNVISIADMESVAVGNY